MRIELGNLKFFHFASTLLDFPFQNRYNNFTGRSKKLELLTDKGKESQPY